MLDGKEFEYSLVCLNLETDFYKLDVIIETGESGTLTCTKKGSRAARTKLVRHLRHMPNPT